MSIIYLLCVWLTGGFQKYLSDKSVQTLIHYPIPPHRQECYKQWNNYSYPVTEKIHAEVVSIPMSAVLTDEEVRKVVEIINQY